VLRQELADPELVHRVDDRPDEAYRHRLDTQLARPVERRHHALLVERDEDVALRVDPLADLEGEVARDVRRRVLELAKRLQLPTLAEQQDVGESLGGEERRPRGLSLDDRVRRARRAVGEDLGAGEELAGRDAELRRERRERLLDALEGAREVGRRLRKMEHPFLVGDDDVREGPARVD
jgi:hypothetical protein